MSASRPVSSRQRTYDGHQLRQLRDIRCDPPRLIASMALRVSGSPRIRELAKSK